MYANKHYFRCHCEKFSDDSISPSNVRKYKPNCDKLSEQISANHPNICLIYY